MPKSKPMFEVNDNIMQEIFDAHKDNTGCLSLVNTFNIGIHTMEFHTCICGKRSRNCDFLILNKYATNSLCVHYLKDQKAI